MGGDITRFLMLHPGFLANETFGSGYIHKVVTIDTPYLGTPLAARLLNSNNSHIRNFLALRGSPAVKTVTSFGQQFSGAAGDFVGDGWGNGLSDALKTVGAT